MALDLFSPVRRLRTHVGLIAAFTACAAGGVAHAADKHRLATYANPVDLPYRYQPAKQPYREAADPTVVRFKGLYWLFPSHSKGYWWSKDLLHWNFIRPSGYDVDKYAPTVEIIRGKLYLSVGQLGKKIWVTDDPMAGVWTTAAEVKPGFGDPDLFLDTDGKLYMYQSLINLEALQLDPQTFQTLATVTLPQARNKQAFGWEVPGDHNEKVAGTVYVEGSWMTKHQGRYYLQFAAPATELKTYADGVFVSDKPMGPFVYQDYSPFSVKPTGFIGGAGHSSTFQGANGRWWHVSTMSISVRHPYERRIGLFPTWFTSTGELMADTYLGDYPHYIDGDRGLTGWMLLSRKKPVTVSSTLDGFPAENAVDEDVRTWWSAKSGGPDEWFQVDLGAQKRIEAVQINFADQDSQGQGISQDVYNYVLEASNDGRVWRTLADHSRAGRDAPHDYEVLPKPQRARFVRLRNVHSPDGGKFSLYDLRVFGSGGGAKPAKAGAVHVARDAADGRRANVSWMPGKGAEFYIVRLGVRPDLMNQNYQIYDGRTAVDVGSLNLGARYCFTVDAVNENGITRGDSATCVD